MKNYQRSSKINSKKSTTKTNQYKNNNNEENIVVLNTKAGIMLSESSKKSSENVTEDCTTEAPKHEKPIYSMEELYKLNTYRKINNKLQHIPEHLYSYRQHRGSNSYNNISRTARNNSEKDNVTNLLPKFARSCSQPKREGTTEKSTRSKSKTNIIYIALTLQEDVKLDQANNAWKPNVLDKKLEANTSDELFKKVRSILNKLTPENCEKLILEIKSFQIDTVDKLKRVIELIYEKAVQEPNFSHAYATVCSALSDVKVKSEITENFKRMLISCCQKEFENIAESKTSSDTDSKQCKSDEERFRCEEDERKLRLRSVGTMRFIAELFKLNMLTVSIMQSCIQHLLELGQEESLECLCKMLTTIGLKLEEKCDVDVYFKQIDEIINDNEKFKISNRIRFMLMDLVDLRKFNWVSRRCNDIIPKKMNEIKKDIEKEEVQEKYLNYSCNNNNNFYSKKKLKPHKFDTLPTEEYKWSIQNSRKNRAGFSNTVFNKLNTKPLNIDVNTELGNASTFMWSKQRQTQSSVYETSTTNKFSALLESEGSTSSLSHTES